MDSLLDFTGKNVLVVGGSSGIGNAAAQAFRARGAQVYVWGTRAAPGDYAEEPGSDLAGLSYARMDVADAAAIAAYAPPFDRLDVLVLSQGIALYKRQEFEMAGFAKVIDVNLSSLMACAMKFHAMLAASRGSLIIVSSSAAFHATKGNPAYNASKAGAYGLTRTLAQAWAGEGIRVNGIAPGYVATKLTKATTDHPHRLKAAVEQIPLGRFGETEEMATIALFLASPMSSYMIGQTLLADGGMLL
ncbi:MAG: SDR family NAD(P)-dependent oxidoreductase [Hyphomonadaceae bacterium]